MKRVIFLFILASFILCFPSIFYAQMNSMDKFKMQQQADQIQSKYGQFRGELQEKHEEATEIFKKDAEKSQQVSMNHMIKLYGIPVVIIAIIGVIFLFIWHQSI